MKKRVLIVIERKLTGERFLWKPTNQPYPVVPDGFIKRTQQVPLNETLFGNLPIYTIEQYKKERGLI